VAQGTGTQAETTTITGEFVNIIIHDRSSGYTVALFLPERGDTIKVVGELEFVPMLLTVGVEGEWTTHDKYGRQFRLKRIRWGSHLDAVTGLLSSGFIKGIKEYKAVRMVQRLGDDVINVLERASRGDQDAIDALISVRGIGSIVAKGIVESWIKQRGWALSALLCTRAGLTLKHARRVYKKYGSDAGRIITEEPYRLTNVPGIGWEEADRIAKLAWPGKTPIDHNSPIRFAAGVREILERGLLDGHSCLPFDAAIQRAIVLCTPSLNNRVNSFWAAICENDLRHESLAVVRQDDERWLYHTYALHAEREVGTWLHENCQEDANGAAVWPYVLANLDLMSYPLKLSDDQCEAIKMALENRVSIITGGPGTGKTTILRTLCRIFNQEGQTITLCAPTGKAARRMKAAIGIGAGTIHRTLLLGIRREDLPAESFQTDIVIIDEMSMCDTFLMYKIVLAMKEDTKLIMVGDADQLPPVGPGEPFYQAILAGVPSTELTVIHRQERDSGIVLAAHSVREGLFPEIEGDFDDFYLTTVSINPNIKERTMKAIQRIRNTYNIGFDELQVLTPVNDHAWGQYGLNLEIQKRYNPNKFILPGLHFKVGDRVVQSKNNYKLGMNGVMNGEVGVITWIASPYDERAAHARIHEDIENGLREEFDPESTGPNVLTVRFESRESVTYDRDSVRQLKLAYALTVHKSQGSEYDYGVLVVPMTRTSFQTRQLIYTGLTRFKKLVVVITAGAAMLRYIQNEQRIRRYTLLGAFKNVEVINGYEYEPQDLGLYDIPTSENTGHAVLYIETRAVGLLLLHEARMRASDTPRVPVAEVQEGAQRSEEPSPPAWGGEWDVPPDGPPPGWEDEGAGDYVPDSWG
jgi:exodeoxyribonuclease V alpha subunit